MEPAKAPESVAKEVLGPLQELGLKVPTKLVVAMALAAVVVPLAYAGWKWLKGRKARRAEMLAAGEEPDPTPDFAPLQLRKAWLRFESTLPRSYRRSLHNFEHVVVVGEAGSGKSTLIDASTDWQRQSKQFIKSQTNDPDLQVYLGSSVVVTELPAGLFQERGAKVRAALRRLWGPLYRVESPVVVVTVNLPKLRESRTEAITDTADRIRGIINVLSEVGGRAVEVRLVATHIDEMPGWTALANLFRANSIPLRINVKTGETAPPTKGQIDSWLERTTAQISRALTQLSSTEFRKTLAWLKEAPAISAPLATFVDALSAKEAVSRDILFGGVYLAALPQTQPNPLRYPKPPGFRRDPTLPHLVAATAGASVLSCLLVAIFAHQRSLWKPAAEALDDYNPAFVGTEAEERRRDAITEFAWKQDGLFSRFPDFFSRARTNIRAHASELIRNELLVPDLRTVASTGHLHEEHLKSVWRRSLYHLGLIHSDKYDGLHILAPDRLEAWSFMTELPPDIIRDYLMMTDAAWTQPVTFDVRVGTSAQTGAADQIGYWTAFLGEVQRTIDLGVLTEDDLKRLQERTEEVMPTLERFTYDGIFRTIMPSLDSTASMAPGHHSKVVQLEATYRPRFAEILENITGSDMFDQRDQLNTLLRTVVKAKLHHRAIPLVADLNSTLAALYDAPEDPSADKKITIRVAGRDYIFDMRKWSALLRDSQAVLSLREFSKARNVDDSIFFGRAADFELRPISWNATNDGTSVFLGTAKIRGRYSRAAYDTYVHDPLVALEQRLDKIKLPASEVSELRAFLADELRAYAVEYHAETARFAESFSVGAPSSEALRVALSQMTADVSPFVQYIDSVSRQAGAQTDSALLTPMGELIEDLAPWKSLGTTEAAGEFGKYRAILGQLLTDLVNAGGAAGGGDSAGKGASSAAKGGAAAHAKSKPAAEEASFGGDGDDDTLEKAISPAARVALSGLRAEKGSYAELVKEWLVSLHMPPIYHGPFLSPLVQLDAIGRVEVGHAVRRVWETEMVNDVAALSSKFPFDRKAEVEATPDEIDAVFNPLTGKFFKRFRDFIEPISEVTPGHPFRELPALRASIAVPEDLFPTVNEVAAIASHLYDGSGKPVPLVVSVEPVPFEHGANVHASVTAMFIGTGESSVYAFNQKPATSNLLVDWTHEHVSQVGVQLTDLTTHQSSFGDPVSTPSSHWSLLRLLSMGAQAAVGAGGAKVSYSWNVHPESGSDEKIRVRFNVVGDPLAPLRLTKLHKVFGPTGAVHPPPAKPPASVLPGKKGAPPKSEGATKAEPSPSESSLGAPAPPAGIPSAMPAMPTLTPPAAPTMTAPSFTPPTLGAGGGSK